jgi:hypothetical protein
MTTDATENHDAARRDGSALSEGLGPLPEPDMTLPSVAPDSPDGAHFYRASTVRRLLDGERERCAKLCDPTNANRPEDWTEYAKTRAECAARIRGA